MRAVAFCGFALLLAAPVARAATFMGLGYLPGGTQSRAEAVSADGLSVVGVSIGDSSDEAFRWTNAGGMVGLGILPGQVDPFERIGSFAYAASADGSTVVGTSTSASGNQAFRWTSDGGMVGLGDLPGGNVDSNALGVSANGSVVVGRGNRSSTLVNEAYRWTSEGGMVGLGALAGAFSSGANAVSSDGSVVVGISLGGSLPSEAFRWTSEGGMVGLGELPGGLFQSRAEDVSADGSIVVGASRSASGLEAFRWTSEGGMLGLGALPSTFFSSQAFAVSADGSVVVGDSAISGSSTRAFVWDPTNGMRPLDQVLTDLGLDLAGWQLLSATDISVDGLTIVGTGSNPSGFLEAWIAVIPEPGTGMLVITGLLGLTGWRKVRA